MAQDFDYCCSRDGHGLSYPSFSVVFIQTFSIDDRLEFFLPTENVLHDYEGADKELVAECRKTNVFKAMADYAGMPVVYMNQDIEGQIFVMPAEENGYVRKRLGGKALKDMYVLNKFSLAPAGRNESTDDVYTFPNTGVYRFSVRGFDFEMPMNPLKEEDFYPIVLKGHVNIEMSLFFGNIASITYRFCFDGNSSMILTPDGRPQDAVTDHIIGLLSTFLGAEYWSDDDDCDEDTDEGNSRINLKTTFMVHGFWLDEDGEVIPAEMMPDEPWIMREYGRSFDNIALRYKKYLLNHYTAYRQGLSISEKRHLDEEQTAIGMSVSEDLHYAMVDIWETVKHMEENDGVIEDLFSKKRKPRLSEAEIIKHINDQHKPELIGLMSLYPGEWPYRDGEAYDDVCGENIAIDTDDLVKAGANLAVVIGTYGRRSNEVKMKKVSLIAANDGTFVKKQGVDWEKHLRERRRYHVSWPEYLMILQMVLARKCVIESVRDQMVEVASDVRNHAAERILGRNADLSVRLSRQIIQLDAIKYSKFTSHRVMFERTSRRLKLDEEFSSLREIIDMTDSSLHNLSDYKNMRSDSLLNIVLLIVSVASTSEVLFQDPSLPFMHYFGHGESSLLAAWLIRVVGIAMVFAFLLLVVNSVKKLWYLFIKKK